jgi:hypothetical protein
MDQQSHHLGFVLLEFFCVSIGRVHRTFSWLCSMFLISTISAIYLYNFALQVQNTTFINCSTNSSLVRTSVLASALVTFFVSKPAMGARTHLYSYEAAKAATCISIR